MASICIIGNSHLSAIKLHMDSLDDDFDKYVFWGVAGKDFPKIKYEDGFLISSNPKYSKLVSGGRYTDLSLVDFDTFWFYGCHAEISRVAIRISKSIARSAFLSSEFKSEYVKSEFYRWWSGLVISSVVERVRRDFPGARIVFTPHPLWSETVTKEDVDRELLEFCLCSILNCLRSFCDSHGIKLLPQPSSTIDFGYTKEEFSKGSIKLATNGRAHDEDDYVHMNSSYGSIIFEDFLRVV